ncbi:MAG: ABC transporter substrate-binding protein [Streptosporangiaceae bacterium]|nr:ABC transporter substrate-binding protein [Streptosporangiaceae bacterium]MBV9854446.1 ABC transporter substrate-binding protein [Streptosporangiaceae bacterium]
MSHSVRRLARALTLAGIAAAGAAATACSSSTPSASPAANTATLGGGVVINLGDQQQDLETMLTASGALNGAPYKVNFLEFDSGPLVDAGFAAHRIDAGFMGDLPASLAVRSGLPVVAIAATRSIGASEYLLAQPGITSIAQLRGKPVAYTTGTSEQAFALRALKSAGLTQNDVHQVNVSLLQLGTALQSGSAVASVVSAEQKASYQLAHPDSRVLATIQTVSPPSYGYTLATRAALADPAKLRAIGDLTKRLIEASNWQKSHQAQWVTDYYVNVEHQTPQVAKLVLAAGGTETYVPITAGVRNALQQMVDIMAASGGLPASFSVTPLYSAAEAARYNAIVRAVPQNG